MLFVSESFLFVFLPITIILYYVVFRRFGVAKNVFLLLSSLLFYAWGEPKYVFLMIGMILLNWLFGVLVDAVRQKQVIAKSVIVFMVFCNLFIIGYFKYRGFFVENMNSILGLNMKVPFVELPIGISFYTFQAISYVVDVYRKDGEVQKNPLYVGLYIAFFPQLIAGPIVRYQTISEQMHNRNENWEDFSNGVCRFIIGLGKKVLISNNLAIVADAAFAMIQTNVYEASVLMAWLGAIAYTFQIFFDFAGYSDMAIGLGKMFGFRFEENFDYPYIAKSVSEFWRRWHISLQTWFRDYVYIPLGGSRVRKKVRLVFNLFVVWLLTGIWHGASWNFVVWGAMYFVLLTAEKLLGFDKKIGRFGHVYTLLFVVIGWVIFRANTLNDAVIYIKAMFGAANLGLIDAGALEYMKQAAVYFVAACICSTPIVKKLDDRFKDNRYWNAGYTLVQGLMLVISLTFIFNQAYSPFIYFNF